PDDLRLAPRPAAVGAAPQQQVDVAAVAAALLAPLAEGEQGALRRDDQRRDAVAVVAALAGREHRLLLDRGGVGHELLDALAIDPGAVDGPARIDAEHVRHPESSRPAALLAEAAQGLAVGVQHLHPAGPAVGHEGPAVARPEEAVGRPALLPRGEELAVGVED